jgi:putative transposase
MLNGEKTASAAWIAEAAEVPRATVYRWVRPPAGRPVGRKRRSRPVAGDPELVKKIKDLCDEARLETHGHRRIRALLRRRFGLRVNRKTVLAVMRDLGLTQERLRFKPARPKHVEKMTPEAPNRAWQIDMTSFALTDLSPLFLMVVIDCFSRKIVGWSLDRRCRAKEWASALRSALDGQGLVAREQCAGLVVRSDNGAQPCSKYFVEYLGSAGVTGQYTGYNAPDDNAFVERVIRTIKEEEIWPSAYDSWSEAHAAVEAYVIYYNNERIHSALDYQTPIEAEAAGLTLIAA